jgi:hypothetical protein
VKSLMAWTCVALAACLFTGATFGQDAGGGKRPDGPQVSGKVKAVAEDGKSITVTVKKDDVENDMVFAVNAETKVRIGRENKAIADVKVGSNCRVTYQAADAGNVALRIRIIGERGEKAEGEAK